MYENKEQKERAVLAGVNTGAFDAEASIDELAELADTAGAEVLAKFIQNRESPDKAAYLEEARESSGKSGISAASRKRIFSFWTMN